jgi:hypothetical protein
MNTKSQKKKIGEQQQNGSGACAVIPKGVAQLKFLTKACQILSRGLGPPFPPSYHIQ